MTMVLVPNALSEAINAKLDVALKATPDAAKDRDVLYQQLLTYFDEHGVIPDFKLEAKSERPTQEDTHE